MFDLRIVVIWQQRRRTATLLAGPQLSSLLLPGVIIPLIAFVAGVSPMFTRRHHHTNYLYHGTIPRLMRTGNSMCSDVDFFDPSFRHFRRNVLAAITSPTGA
ncbi:hypothetical protein J6590_095377 [Homalodisca vitripennis]|nr:hypothetical protein J6590_095377 [Homalodisca vitripennis]